MIAWSKSSSKPLLTNDEITQACKLVTQAQAHFVKTSTGFGNAGATLEHGADA